MSPGRHDLIVALVVAVLVQTSVLMFLAWRTVAAVNRKNPDVTVYFLLTHRWPLVKRQYRQLYPDGQLLKWHLAATAVGAVASLAIIATFFSRR